METRIQRKGAFNDAEGKIIFAQLLSAMKHLVQFYFPVSYLWLLFIIYCYYYWSQLMYFASNLLISLISFWDL